MIVRKLVKGRLEFEVSERLEGVGLLKKARIWRMKVFMESKFSLGLIWKNKIRN